MARAPIGPVVSGVWIRFSCVMVMATWACAARRPRAKTLGILNTKQRHEQATAPANKTLVRDDRTAEVNRFYTADRST